MKAKRWFIPLVLAVVLIGLTGWLSAQGGPGDHHRQGRECDFGTGPGGPGGHGDAHRLLHVLRKASDLGITDEQIEQIEAVFETARPRIEALTEQLRGEKEAWREATDPAVFDEVATRHFADGQATLHADLMVLGMQTRAEALSYLTIEQRDALKEMMDSMRGRFGGKRHPKGSR